MTRVVGKSTVRVDARDKVTGEARYPGDMFQSKTLELSFHHLRFFYHRANIFHHQWVAHPPK